MLNPIMIPRGVSQLFLIGQADVYEFDESTKNRPDKVLDNCGQYGIKSEIVSNYVSVQSPISAVKGTAEIVPKSLFRAYFEV